MLAFACLPRAAPWRYQARCPWNRSPCGPRFRSPDFPPALSLARRRQRSPSSSAISIITAISEKCSTSKTAVRLAVVRAVNLGVIFESSSNPDIRMKTKEAKDFLVNQAVEQATLDGISLSDVEKRMMYFSESAGSMEELTSLNDEFESKYDSAEYETKISSLLQHAYRRLKTENPAAVGTWDDAIRALRKGDHYILVMWDSKAGRERPPHDTLKLVGTALLIVAVAMLLILTGIRFEPVITRFTDRIPHIDGRIVLAIFVVLYVLAFLPMKRAGDIFKKKAERTASRFKLPK